jgi:mevalonate kinase
MLKPIFSKYAESEFFAANNDVVQSVEHSGLIPFDALVKVSHYQIDYFTPMIPESFRKHFFAGLNNGRFAFKICGSGGGGFMLCFTHDEEFTEHYLRSEGLRFIKVNE